MKRIFAFLLVFSLMLSGCGTSRSGTAIQTAIGETLEESVPTTQYQKPEQRSLSAQEQALVLEQTEFSLLAAAFLYDAYAYSFTNEGYSTYDRFAHIADMDRDGQTEMYYSQSLLYFDPTDGRSCTYSYSSAGNQRLFLSAEGCVYYSFSNEEMERPHGEHWDSGLPVYYYSPDPDAQAFMVCSFYCPDLGAETEEVVQLDGRDLSVEESKAFLDQLGLTPVKTTLRDYTSFTYDGAYTDSIAAALENAFGSYKGTYTLDIDRDGQDEQVFTYTDFVNPWFPDEALHPSQDPYFGDMHQAFYFDYPDIDPTDNRTGLIVADPQGEELVLKAYSIPEKLWNGCNAEKDYIDGSTMHIGGIDWLVPQGIAGQDAEVSYIEERLQESGYRELFFARADISDLEDEEILCFGKRDGKWVLLVIQLRYGIPGSIKRIDLSDSACYLSTFEGKNYLMVYSQTKTNNAEGIYTSYRYRLWRFDLDLIIYEIHGESVGHYNDQEDATNVAEFFDRMNRYMMNVVVLYDPFCLHGQQWASPETVIRGQTPQEPEDTEQTQTDTSESVIGFVDILDPSSWLNLREGPGRSYPCILTDPQDPGSIVKQAKGSPVTVLETVASEDPEFPEWYKVRIRYQDHEIVGYSAKEDIRLSQ